MTDSTSTAACTPGADRPSARTTHFALIRRLFDIEVEERRPVANGYAFRFPGHVLPALARFLDAERTWRPFLRYDVTLPPGSETIWLTISGPEGTRQALEAELLGAG